MKNGELKLKWHLWGEKSPGPVNSLHFAFTLGGLLAPPTTAPFLYKPSGGNSTGNGTNGLADMFTSAVHDMRHMWTPYMHEEIYSVTGDDHILTATNLSISINKDMYLFDDAINANKCQQYYIYRIQTVYTIFIQ